jgi:hypothetical protein
LSQPEPPRASPALKIIHAVVFWGFCALAIAAASPELDQVRFAQRGDWHAGTPPFWPALLGAGLSLGGAVVLGVRLVQRREVTLFVSGSILLGFGVALTVNATAPSQRSVESANVALLEVARELQRQMGARLQKDAAVPTEPAAWAEGLAEAQKVKADFPPAVRSRAFALQGFATQRVEAEDWEGQGAPPDTLGVWISADRVTFTITPVGISNLGEAVVLLDDLGRPIRLRGVFNPDMH